MNFYIIITGIVAGALMSAWCTLAQYLQLTTLDLGQYDGCLLTGEKTGKKSFIIALLIHFAISVVIAYLYAGAFFLLHKQPGMRWGLIFGLMHWVISSMVVPISDRFNPCVKNGSLHPLDLAARGYGRTGMLVFLTAHLLYGAAVGGLFYYFKPA
jgi:hypothetical protein